MTTTSSSVLDNLQSFEPRRTAIIACPVTLFRFAPIYGLAQLCFRISGIMVNTDVAGFCLPNTGNCSHAWKDLPQNAWEALLFFAKLRWLTDCKPQGEKNFGQYPDWACWYNLPLCCSMCWIPCCCPVVYMRNMEKMTGQSCESQCVTCCVLSCCCYMNMCYYASKRTEFREKYGIRGSPCCDCFCFPCSQMCYTCVDANELQERGGYEIPFCGAKAATAIRTVTLTDKLTTKVGEVNDRVTDNIAKKITPNRT